MSRSFTKTQKPNNQLYNVEVPGPGKYNLTELTDFGFYRGAPKNNLGKGRKKKRKNVHKINSRINFKARDKSVWFVYICFIFLNKICNPFYFYKIV